MIELLMVMVAAYEELKDRPPNSRGHSEIRDRYILRLNEFGVLTQEQIAVCCCTTRTTTHAVLRANRVVASRGTKGIINPHALEVMLLVAKQVHNGEPLEPETYRVLVTKSGDLGIISKLVAIPLYLLKGMRYAIRDTDQRTAVAPGVAAGLREDGGGEAEWPY